MPIYWMTIFFAVSSIATLLQIIILIVLLIFLIMLFKKLNQLYHHTEDLIDEFKETIRHPEDVVVRTGEALTRKAASHASRFLHQWDKSKDTNKSKQLT